jgi:hypothetical protein
MTAARIAAITGRARAICVGKATCFATAAGRGLPPLTIVGPWSPITPEGQRLLGLSVSMRVDAEGRGWRYWIESELERADFPPKTQPPAQQ